MNIQVAGKLRNNFRKREDKEGWLNRFLNSSRTQLEILVIHLWHRLLSSKRCFSLLSLANHSDLNRRFQRLRKVWVPMDRNRLKSGNGQIIQRVVWWIVIIIFKARSDWTSIPCEILAIFLRKTKGKSTNRLVRIPWEILEWIIRVTRRICRYRYGNSTNGLKGFLLNRDCEILVEIIIRFSINLRVLCWVWLRNLIRKKNISFSVVSNQVIMVRRVI